MSLTDLYFEDNHKPAWGNHVDHDFYFDEDEEKVREEEHFDHIEVSTEFGDHTEDVLEDEKQHDDLDDHHFDEHQIEQILEVVEEPTIIEIHDDNEKKDFETLKLEFDESHPLIGERGKRNCADLRPKSPLWREIQQWKHQEKESSTFLTNLELLDFLAEENGWEPISYLTPAMSESKSYETNSFKITVHGNRTVRKFYKDPFHIGNLIEVAAITSCTSEQIRDLFKIFVGVGSRHSSVSPQKKRKAVDDTPIEHINVDEESFYSETSPSEPCSPFSPTLPVDNIAQQHPHARKKRRVIARQCHFFLQGYCRFGEHCHFSHEM